MKPEVILKKAIQKAVKNGYSFEGWLETKLKSWEVKDGAIWLEAEPRKKGVPEDPLDLDTMGYHSPLSWRDIVFSHGFAKAYFGSAMLETDRIQTNDLIPPPRPNAWHVKREAWKVHLENMVTSEKPLRYLERFLNYSC